MSRISPREEALFADALALPPAERGSFLAKACGANVDVLAHLVALVAAHEGPESLTSPIPRLTDLPAKTLGKVEEEPGDSIGRYKLLQKIGEGGCGMVWVAEQEEPVRRRVALKVIKLDSYFTVPDQRWIFDLLGTPPEHKQHILIDAGHIIRAEMVEKEVGDWLDRFLGPVK